jgi:hypothetical protein
MPLSHTRDKLRQLAVGPQGFRNDVYDALVRQFGEYAEIVQEIRRLNESSTTDRQETLKYHDRFDEFPLGRPLAQAVLSGNAQDTAHLPMLSISNDSCQLSFQLGGVNPAKQHIPLVATFQKWDAVNNTDDGNNSTWWQFVDLNVNGLGANVNLMSSRHIAFTYVGQNGSADELKVVTYDREFVGSINDWVEKNEQWESASHADNGEWPVYVHVQKRSNSAQKRTADEAFNAAYIQKRQRRQAIMEACKQVMQANVQP